MIDVDDFKRYNDTYGHIAGDEALRQVAAVARSASNRPRDTVARYGGEEFAVVLPETGLEGALTVAERTRGELEKRKISHGANRAAPYLTISLGVAHAHRQESDPQAFIARADAALYVAKGGGRNRVAADQAPIVVA